MADEWDVFISYNEHDKSVAETLLKTLEDAGITCWIAPRNVRSTTTILLNRRLEESPGYEDAIYFAIDHSRAMIIIVSGKSMRSDHVKAEINRGKDSKLTFFPVRIEDTPLVPTFSYHLGRTQWINCFDGNSATRFASVLQDVKDFLEQNDAEIQLKITADRVAEASKNFFDHKDQTINAETQASVTDQGCARSGSPSPSGSGPPPKVLSGASIEHEAFTIILKPWNLKYGQFIPGRHVDHWFGEDGTEARICLGSRDDCFVLRVDRKANSNGSVRFYGGTRVKKWLGDNFKEGEKISVIVERGDMPCLFLLKTPEAS